MGVGRGRAPLPTELSGSEARPQTAPPNDSVEAMQLRLAKSHSCSSPSSPPEKSRHASDIGSRAHARHVIDDSSLPGIRCKEHICGPSAQHTCMDEREVPGKEGGDFKFYNA